MAHTPRGPSMLVEYHLNVTKKVLTLTLVSRCILSLKGEFGDENRRTIEPNRCERAVPKTLREGWIAQLPETPKRLPLLRSRGTRSGSADPPLIVHRALHR